MRRGLMLLLLALLQACAASPNGGTLADLRRVEPDLREVAVDESLDKAMASYRRFLEQTETNSKTPEAMRRLADLQIEKRYGIIGAESATGLAPPAKSATPLPAPEDAVQVSAAEPGATAPAAPLADLTEDEAAFVARASGMQALPELASPGASFESGADPREAIETYQQILREYPHYERNDQVLYQMARAYDELGEPDEAMRVMERLIREYGYSEFSDEVYFRRAEYFFVRRKYLDAEEAYAAVTAMGEASEFYELALYKLGWSLYKQELYEDALHQYMALLDYKVSIGYDFDRLEAVATVNEGDAESGAPAEVEQEARSASEEDERRVADTFRVISLSFSNLGGPEVLNEYFASTGNRGYEDRIYSNLGEFYLAKLRYNDAATVYRSFTELNPYHRLAPRFSMRVVDIYDEGGFAQLVVEAKEDFAQRYALDSAYWDHFDVAESTEVLVYLKTNLKDLAGHFHSLYQDESLVELQGEHYGEAQRWYGEYLKSFPADEEAPAINYRLADLLLENEDFQPAALAYERTAYDYATHEQSAAAGYAAIFAHREHLSRVDEAAHGEAQLATVSSSLRFADTFPAHEHAATVLGAAVQDLYDMSDYERAVTSGRLLVERYPQADETLRRSAWTVVAHASMDLGRFADAEQGYGEVLTLADEDDEGRQALYDNLAAAIYKQGEAARDLEDHRAAADHFLRISTAAPTSEIRPAAEYDAAIALMKLEDWGSAAEVLQAFRLAHVDHELQSEVTKQLAFVYREAGELVRSAEEYETVADDAEDPELRRESLLLAGDLYDDADADERALEVFSRYVEEYPQPIDLALEIRYRMAGLHEAAGAQERYHGELELIVAIDAEAGAERTPRTKFLAGQSALVLAELSFEHFDELKLTLPFADSLAEKQARMDAALSEFEQLVSYEVAQVTTAATFYMAEIYSRFGIALLESERPGDLEASERLDYDLALEGEAFPFEERAIEVHEENVELMVAGTYDGWVRRSLDRLAELMPGRYAKAEISAGFMGPVEVFAYRTPAADLVPTTPAGELSQQTDDAGELESEAEQPAEGAQGASRDVTAAF